MARLNQWRISGVLFLFSAVVGHAQIFQQVDFNGINGGWPQLMSLVQGYDGAFYGTTSSGGQTGWGTVFRITPDGEIKTIYSFCQNPPNCSDGATPQASLLLATDGNLYGTTSGLGTLSPGTVFRVDRHGILTNVRLFNGSAGGGPAAGLVQGTDGNLYGTTVGGGSQGLGTIFRMTLGGALTTLAAFDGIAAWFPEASLIEGTDGSFYGTTLFGGCGLCPRCPCGTVFKVTPNGALTILHTFTGADGAFPSAPLVQASDGNFYGATLGTYLGYQYFGPGTVFRMTRSGELTTLYQFCARPNCSDGDMPAGGLVFSKDGNFYGTASYGGNGPACDPLGCGTVFRMTPQGSLTILHTFLDMDGADSQGGLLQSTTGIFYGTTMSGGDLMCFPHPPMAGCGTVFSLNTGLAPFVAFVQAAGRIGRTAQILGQGFEGTTDVAFNGVTANFTVRADTFLTAVVPPCATTGYTTVTTPSGVLKSNVPFHVIQ